MDNTFIHLYFIQGIAAATKNLSTSSEFEEINNVTGFVNENLVFFFSKCSLVSAKPL